MLSAVLDADTLPILAWNAAWGLCVRTKRCRVRMCDAWSLPPICLRAGAHHIVASCRAVLQHNTEST